MQLFYSTDIQDGLVRLSAEEARHCTQVLRKQIGDSIQVVDGKGHWYEAVLVEISKKTALASIESERKEQTNRTFRVHISIAPTKNISRLEWFLEKATEIGVDEISLLLCQRSERKVVRLDRLEKVVLSAMKQSLKATLPRLNELCKFKAFIEKSSQIKGQKFIGYCEDSVNIHLKQNYKAGSDVCILIGPEGDFSPEEVALAQAAGFEAISLGESRLRTETAGVVACHAVHLLNEK